MAPIGLPEIEAARDVIQGIARDTPLKRSGTLSDMLGADFHLKLENFQRTGSFKVRGALNKIASLTDAERSRGVVAASAGNHAQGVAFAATRSDVKSTVFMPRGASFAKAAATRGYGATVNLGGLDYQEAFERAEAYCKEQDAVFVHAFDDPYIIAGQGTLGLEVMRDLPDIDAILIPIGGGGLIAGAAAAVKAINPAVRVIGVQAAGASTVAPSLAKGRVVVADSVQTMADGIAARRLGALTFDLIQQHVDEVVTVSEPEIAAAILFLLERTKVLAEGAGAVTLAAAMHRDLGFEGQRVCAVISGGNIDTSLLGRIIHSGLVKEGRIAVIDTTVPDKPGHVAKVLDVLAEHDANVLDIHHDRERRGVPLHEAHLEVVIEAQGNEHVAAIFEALRARGIDVSIQE